ncbi:hypothetical protein [Streptomyces mangrovisoli]|uniref:Uncharacterized protein n=1 Tax=Streptomyces mangrovisoli TaxID=1428628 RepID=A0A1J4NX47_9ACTN|nr:hypothetical protein [Streptomyces mangrovisoli]OIJ66068.1 hypothetical protein WN71_020620 [Streptomyces mangrovisoli]
MLEPERQSFTSPHHSELSDVDLLVHLTADAARARDALRLLRTRHLPAARHYARLCVIEERFADQLAHQALSSVAHDAAAGRVRRCAVRHSLLLLIQDLAAAWAADDRHQRLAGDFSRWLLPIDDGGVRRAVPRWTVGSDLLHAFWRLPQPEQELLWYTDVETAGRDFGSLYAGTALVEFDYHHEGALTALRRAYLQVFAEGRGQAECRGYVRILEAQSRAPLSGLSPEFDEHRKRCTHCEQALRELATLHTAPGRCLVERLIGYQGPAYVRRGLSPEVDEVAHPAAQGGVGVTGAAPAATAGRGKEPPQPGLRRGDDVGPHHETILAHLRAAGLGVLSNLGFRP